jgi:hypothetical protein
MVVAPFRQRQLSAISLNAKTPDLRRAFSLEPTVNCSVDQK